jgi:hypothetical protein
MGANLNPSSGRLRLRMDRFRLAYDTPESPASQRKERNQLGTMVHACNFSPRSGEIHRELQFEVRPDKIFIRLYLNQGLGTVMHAYLPATQGSINEAHSPYWPGHKRRPYLKNNQAQRAAICLAC